VRLFPRRFLKANSLATRKGAFTGATQRRIGRFEEAHEGTLFLDENRKNSLEYSGETFKNSSGKEFQRLGSNMTLKADVRVLAATNRHLVEAMKKGSSERTSITGLNVISIQLPPLRERKEDIPLLVDYFLKKYAKENQKPVTDISKEARISPSPLSLPRQCERVGKLDREGGCPLPGEVITTEDLPFHLREGKPEEPRVFHEKEKQLIESLEEIEKDMILKALQQHQGVQTKAAESLGISERVLRYKMKNMSFVRLEPPFFSVRPDLEQNDLNRS